VTAAAVTAAAGTGTNQLLEASWVIVDRGKNSRDNLPCSGGCGTGGAQAGTLVFCTLNAIPGQKTGALHYPPAPKRSTDDD